ncbi:hypothetical protein BCV70DRAFT_91507 [Testicularia cyperi]|uniref:Uncharacterized protein n=1 Tax=Testicularia cyperi TaxID=1882483 RepID=A0A317XSH0_9BASI|nr:hypothetical protein BCV70DRAFT_91507 [Testicularia cyperi]
MNSIHAAPRRSAVPARRTAVQPMLVSLRNSLPAAPFPSQQYVRGKVLISRPIRLNTYAHTHVVGSFPDPRPKHACGPRATTTFSVHRGWLHVLLLQHRPRSATVCRVSHHAHLSVRSRLGGMTAAALTDRNNRTPRSWTAYLRPSCTRPCQPLSQEV